MSTAFNDIRLALESYVATNYTNNPTSNANPTEFENVDFNTPAASKWARLSLGYVPSGIAGFGSTKRFRHTGIISVSVFTPKDKSSIAAYNEADVITTLLRLKNISGVQTLTPSVSVVGNSGAWYQLNVTVPFYYDEISAT